MNYYLLKIKYDTNDADYVYGLQVINQKEYEVIQKNLNKNVSFGSSDFFGDKEVPLKHSIEITPITEQEREVFVKYDLLNFGEGDEYWLEDWLYEEDNE